VNRDFIRPTARGRMHVLIVAIAALVRLPASRVRLSGWRPVREPTFAASPGYSSRRLQFTSPRGASPELLAVHTETVGRSSSRTPRTAAPRMDSSEPRGRGLIARVLSIFRRKDDARGVAGAEILVELDTPRLGAADVVPAASRAPKRAPVFSPTVLAATTGISAIEIVASSLSRGRAREPRISDALSEGELRACAQVRSYRGGGVSAPMYTAESMMRSRAIETRKSTSTEGTHTRTNPIYALCG